MRITDSMVYGQSLHQLQQQYSELNLISAQVSTGQRNALVSDDPAAAGTVLRTDASARAVTQYRRNITSARTRLTGEESTLDQVTDLLARAKEIATQQGSDTSDASARAAAATEVQSLLGQVISLGNLKIGDEYTFGGSETTTPPFQSDGSYSGNGSVRQTTIDQGSVIDTSHSGQQLFVDSGVISSLQQLQTALQGNNPTGIRSSITTIDTAYDQTQTNLAEVGARTDTLDNTVTQLDSRSTALTATRSDAADIPIEEASVHLATVQNALQAGLLATSRILNTNLVDYLK
jgi:flagellar hook-associated protein 3 FlgL